jgi:hypothetical protein
LLVVAVGGAVAVLLTALLPWARTGEARRSAFSLARTVDALGLAETLSLQVLLKSFFLLPILVGVCWTLAALGRPRLAGLVGALIGAMGVGAGLVVLAAPVTAAVGAAFGILAGTASLAASVALLVRRGGTSERRLPG